MKKQAATKRSGNGRRVVEVPGRRTIEFNDPNLSSMGQLILQLQSTAPLIQHCFGKKARQAMLDKQMGVATGKRPPKNPDQEFLDAMHIIGKRPKTADDLPNTVFGMPVMCFKHGAIRAAKGSGSNMTDARVSFFVEADHDDLVRLEVGSLPVMRQDPVRIQSTWDIRIRPEFPSWSCELRIHYPARQVTAEQLTSWFVNAGYFNGIGEWRPGGKMSSGVFGTYEVVGAEAIVPDFRGE